MRFGQLVDHLRGHDALRGVRLLVLHGSRARGDAGPLSDWDLGVLGAEVDLPALVTAVVDAVGTDAVDVADLTRSSALLRYRAARDGVALFEAAPGEFEQFRLEAVLFWCDAGPVIRAAQDDVLESL